MPCVKHLVHRWRIVNILKAVVRENEIRTAFLPTISERIVKLEMGEFNKQTDRQTDR